MRVLVVGSGGRESAIAWACRQHGHQVRVEPAFDASRDRDVDLVIVGPESALVAGTADACAAAGVACFGPSASLARLESSKGFTRALAHELGIPSPAFFRTDDAHDALKWWRTLERPVVVKADGLAAGKGVIVPDTPADTDAAIRTLADQGPIVLEERLTGPECSLLALCDGRIARPLPLAQDHKRIADGDAGPNTGGMGAYAPAPVPYDAEELTKRFVQPVLDHMAAKGERYVGVLYAGLMLTDDGPKLLEFNCRFGDPETQAVLPLLQSDLAAARDAAYTRMSGIHFDGMQVRRDIGWRAVPAALASYAAAGVDIDEGARAVAGMKTAVERTHTPAVLAGVGSFGGAFSAAAIKAMDDPVLVASTDGVGTKVELAARLGRYRGVGIDIVNHCIDDVLVQGATPLFFLDYIAASTLDATQVAEVVTGMAAACEAAGCVLLGGETAEMPGVYAPGAFDIAGTLVGVVDRADLLPTPDVEAGDVLIGVASNGPHTNGYSLLRKVFSWLPMDATPAGFDRPLGETLLVPHRNYLPVLRAALATRKVKALAHITGGGLPENLPRVLPDGVAAEVRLGSWPVPPLFDLVRQVCTSLDTHELYRTLNMGIGMVLVCRAADVTAVQATIDERTWVIGELIGGDRQVHLVA